MNRFRTIQPLIAAILFAAGSLGALYYMWFAVEQYKDELIMQMQSSANQDVLEAQYAELMSVVEQTETDRTVLEGYVLHNEEDTIELLALLEDIADKQQVELTTRSLNVTDGDSTFDNLELIFGLAGAGANVDRLIQIFETLPYHSEVTSLSYSRDERSVRVSASIALRVTIAAYDQ